MTSIDERIVNMQFNNKQFEEGVQTSVKSLDNLRKGLDDTGKGDGLSAIQTGVGIISERFSTLGVIGITALQNITNSAINAGKQLLNSLAIKPITDGFAEYELKMDSVQTIMAGSGESLDTVNKYLEELNVYADRTIYSFKDMTSNIGKFTNAGVKLEDAVLAIQGVSNVAALSGANANEASRAMYNFSQALSSGFVKLIDWKSIENANMATVEFKNQLLESAVAAGTVKKNADGMYQVLTANAQGKKMPMVIDATHNFNDSLQYQWMTTEALVGSLRDYADETTDIGKRAFAAAQDVKTFSQLMDTVKEAIGSGWAKSFELAVGDFDEAKKLFTNVNNVVSGFVDKMSDARNDLLGGALTSGWKQLMSKGITSTQDFEAAIAETAKEHGIFYDKIIEREGSFINSLKSGWVTSDILKESVGMLADKFRDLSDEQLIEMGYSRKAADEMLELDEAVKSGAISMEDFAKKIAGASGRELAIEGIANALKFVASILKPIGDGFREIFPPLAADRLYEMISGFKSFTDTLKISDKTAADIKSTFKGIFAAFDIGGQFISFLAGKFGELMQAMAPGGGKLLALTAGIGEWIVGLNDAIRTGDLFNVAFEKVKEGITSFVNAVKTDIKGMMATPFFETLQENLASAGDKIKEAFEKLKRTMAGEKLKEALDKIKQIFSSFKGIDLSGVKSFVDGAVENFRPFTALGNALSSGLEIVQKAYEKAAPFLNRIAEVVGKAVNGISQTVGGAFRDGGLQGVLDLVNGGLFAGILLGIKNFMSSLTEITDGASGFLGGITDILDGVKGSLEAYQNSLKANTLLTIASAVAVLAAALVVLSLIDPAKLGVALVAITTLFIELAGSMLVLNNAMGSGKMVKVAGEMVGMSVAILILAAAMKSLAELSWEELMKGAIGITLLTAILVTAAESLSKVEKKLLSGGVGMIAMATAIVILAQAVKQLGGEDLVELLKGLGAVGILMAEVAGFTQIVKPEKLMSTGVAMNAMGASMLIFAEAVKRLGEMDLANLAKGVGAIGVIFAEIAGFTQIVKPEKLISTGIAMIAMGAALTIIAGVVQTLGALPLGQMAVGLLGMGGALAAIAGFTQIVKPTDLMVTGLALIGVGAGLTIIAQALLSFGSMSWEELAIGLIALAGSLAIIAVAAHAMTAALPGAAAMLVMAGAIAIFAPALQALGSMDLAEIGKALLALVGVFAVIGVAGLVLAPLTPVILGLAAAIALLGVGVLAIGAGLLAFSAGLTAMAVAGAAGVATMTLYVTSAMNLIPLVIQKLGEGVILFARIIKDGMPTIMEAVHALADGLISVLVDVTPSLVEAVLLLLLALFKTIEENNREFNASALRIIANFLKGLADGTPDVVEGAVDLIVAFIEAIGKESPRIIDAGYKMIIDFVNGLADAIRNNTGPMVESFGNLGGAMIDGMIAGVTAGISAAVDAAKNIGSAMLGGIKNLLGIKSPSKVFEEEVGKNVALGTAQGIDKNADKASKAAKKMADDAYSAATLWIKDYRNDTDYLASEELKMWELLATKYEGVSKEKVEIDKSIAGLREKIAKEEYDAAKSRIKDYQNDVSYSAGEEKKMWEALQGKYAKYSKERIEIDKNIADLQAKADKDSFNRSKDWISQKKALNELSVTEEIAAWERVQSRYLAGTEERKEADRQLYDAKQRLFDEQERLMAKMDDAEKRYQDSVDQRTQSIVKSYGLFDELKEKEEVAGKTLTDNLKAQVKDMQEWAANLATLAKKGIDEGLLAELQQMGPSAGAEIAALSKMSEKQLTEYEDLWKTKTALARTQAISELKALREETNAEVAAIKADLDALTEPATPTEADKADVTAFTSSGKASIDAVVEGYKAKAPEVIAAIEDIHADANLAMGAQNPKFTEAGETLILSFDKGMRAKTPDVISTCKAITSKAIAELAAALNGFFTTGQQTANGYVDGMRSRIAEAAQAAASIARAAYLAAMQELDIHSPSRKFAEIGRMTVLGMANGIKANTYLPEQEATKMGSGIIDSFKEAIASIGEVMNGDLDLAPTIRPVIDISKVQSGVKDMNSAFQRQIDLSAVLGSTASVARSMRKSDEDIAAPGKAGTPTMIFQQTNQSPKALSRLEIYRNTKNQFSAMKEVLAKA